MVLDFKVNARLVVETTINFFCPYTGWGSSKRLMRKTNLLVRGG